GRLSIALGVEDRGQRHQLLRESKEKGWAERELQRAVQQLKGSKRGGGRPRKQIQSQGPLADAAELVRLTETWLDFHEHLWSRTEASDALGMDAHAFDNLRLLLEQAAFRLKQLQASARHARSLAESLLGKSAVERTSGGWE